jgi:hypothetical protein
VVRANHRQRRKLQRSRRPRKETSTKQTNTKKESTKTSSRVSTKTAKASTKTTKSSITAKAVTKSSTKSYTNSKSSTSCDLVQEVESILSKLHASLFCSSYAPQSAVVATSTVSAVQTVGTGVVETDVIYVRTQIPVTLQALTYSGIKHRFCWYGCGSSNNHYPLCY